MALARRLRADETFDVCCVGHVCRDTIRIGDRTAEGPGGTTYYLPLALRRLGRRVAAITKLAKADEGELLSELRAAGVEVSQLESAATTAFENEYAPADPDRRVQRASAVASPFTREDLGQLRARVYHLGPLTNRDMGPGFLEAVATRGEVSLDAQGLLRRVQGGEIRPCPWPQLERGLAAIAVLKASGEEAELLVGEGDAERAARLLVKLGPREVVVTLGSQGSVVACREEVWHVPAVPAGAVVDPTGCGDTYMAAYLHRRLAGDDPGGAGRFAAAVAALALRSFGPFRGTAADAERLLHERA
ncbi:MAG: PfkB family carbohydrate kinase [Myxococcota bacterium]